MEVITLLGNMGPIHQSISLEGVQIEMGSLTLVEFHHGWNNFYLCIQIMYRLIQIHISKHIHSI